MRSLAVVGMAAVSLSCADQSVGVRRGGLARLPIAPVFLTAPSGGPNIEIARISGVLKRQNATDSSVAVAPVDGDSAILQFENVEVTGDSTMYTLGVKAFDANDVVVFEGTDEVTVKPGDNAPAAPELEYTAPDATTASLEIQVGGESATTTDLQWAGAAPGNTSCLNRVPSAAAVTQVQLSVVGRNAANTTVPDVRAGYTSRDTLVATVDETGLVRARCSNKFTYVVARTYLDVVDSVKVHVAAPPFTLIMSPEGANLQRGATLQMTALVVDENGNSVAASQVSYASSDESRATVSASGLVSAIRNGRVVITASSADRTTVGIVEVVRPTAAFVKVIPQTDTIGFGQIRRYFARAFDAEDRVIGDATEFQWSSSNPDVATVAAATGVATAKQAADTVTISAAIDGKIDGAVITVVTALPPGTIKSVVKDGVTDAPISGADISLNGVATTTSVTDGSFSLPGVRSGDEISISKTGYVTVTFFDAPAFPNQTIHIPNVPLPPDGSVGSMNGKVVSALTGSGISGMTVKAYAGLNAAPSPRRPDVQPVATTTTASNGSFSFNVAVGAYTFIATGTGYAEGVGVGISVSGGRTTPDILLPPSTTGGALYVVLTWGVAGGTNVPADLDAHITGPVSTSDATRFQVFSGNRAFLAGVDTVAALDVADASGPGPEVLSLRPSAGPGMYRFYVKNISNTTATGKSLADSASARVDVFLENRVIATFFPPAGDDGTLWEVFRYDGARIFPVGVISTPVDPTTLPFRAKEPPMGPTGPPIEVRPRRVRN